MSWKSYHTKELKDKYLFKFLSLKHLNDFLKTGSIWFSRADVFGDKMECVRIAELKKAKPDFEAIEKRKERFLISCWHRANKESLALWDTYSDTKKKRRIGAIRFNRQELTSIICNAKARNDTFFYKTKWIHGKVLYKNLINASEESLTKNVLKHPSFRKESAFEYENEYRFVIELIQQTSKEGFAYNIGEPIMLPFHILINPLLNKGEYLRLKQIIINKGFSAKLEDSTLAKWLKPELW